ncbi:MAG: hypothetical protein KatS3mg077_3182 [Candidatus Binatia bacterium]|nr:MAG: hypothetical protein KatS3mg077_3182 [Candidatus Binatia bacterium]
MVSAQTHAAPAPSPWLPVLVALALLHLGPAASTAAAAAEIAARAQLEPQRVRAGEAALLTIEISGSQDAAPPSISLPDGVSAEYIGPATQVTIVNGRIQASVQHRYSVAAKTPGTYRLGPFTVFHGGQRYETNAVTLEVARGGQGGGSVAGEALRLIVRVPRTHVYLREKVPVDVLVYVGAVRVGDLQYPTLTADGCAVERFQEPTQYQEQEGNVTYTVVRFSSSLTPLRSGKIVLGPATAQLNVYERRRGGFFDDPFFSFRRPVTLESEAVELSVEPLPEQGRPRNFSGAVGRFSLQVEASPLELNVGDPLTLRIVLRGQGNLDGVAPPALSGSPQWRVYEPHPVAGAPGEFVFEQVAVPTRPLDSVPPIEFSYFDPELGRYQIERSAPVAIVVRGGSQSPAVIAAQPTPAQEDALGRDIVYLKEHPGRWVPVRQRVSFAFVAAHGGLLLLPVAAYFADRHRRRREDRAIAQRHAAARLAARAARECGEAVRQGEAARFYDLAAQYLREYLTLRFQLPPGRLAPETLEQLPLDGETRAAAANLLQACEAARFGRQVVDAELAAHYALFERVLQAAERSGRAQRIWRLWALALLLPPLAGAARGATPDELFYRGNSAYADRDYAAAIAAYEGAIAQGVASANLFFNLGNAYFKAGHLGKAILNYERARWLAPRDADVLANLEFARAQAHSPACTPQWWEHLLWPLASRLSPMALWSVVSSLYAAVLVAGSLAILHRNWRPRWGIAAVAFAAALAFTGANLFWREFFRPWGTYAVTLQTVAVRFAPESTATEHFRLPAGAPVRIRERRGDWALVQRCDGRRGWVPAVNVEALDPSVPEVKAEGAAS